MNFLIILPFTIRGGAEEYALTLASSAVTSGFEVHVAFPDISAADSLKRDFLDHGIIYHTLNNSFEPFISSKILTKGITYISEVLHLFKDVCPNTVMMVLPWPDKCLAPILAAAFKNIPAVVVFQLVPPDYPKIPYFLKCIYKWTRGRKQQWVAISDNNREILSRIYNVPAEDICRIYNGSRMPTSTLSESAESIRVDVRRELAIPESSKILLTVGRLHPQKGYDCLINLAPSILNDFPGCFLVWAGEGELRETLERSIQEQELNRRILLLGHRQDIHRLMRASDLFLFPSRFEGGQSFVITEAMTSGLPIVSSNASGIGEVIHHNIHGLLSNVGDSDSFKKNIYWALQNPAEMHAMSLNARIRANEFSEEKMISETIKLIHDKMFRDL